MTCDRVEKEPVRIAFFEEPSVSIIRGIPQLRTNGRKGDSVVDLESVGNGKGPRGVIHRTIKIFLERRLTHVRLRRTHLTSSVRSRT